MARLSGLMFLQSCPLGCWGVTIGTFIAANTGDQGSGAYSAGFIGYSTAAGAIGGLLSPVLFGLLSDRFFSTQKLLALLHFGCAASMVGVCLSTTQVGMFLALLCYFQCYVPSISLSNKIGLRHLADPDTEFPYIRLFGTLGWISAGLLVGMVWPYFFGKSIEDLRTPFLLGLSADLVVAVYALTLPHSPPEHTTKTRVSITQLLQESVALIRKSRVALFLVVAMIACLPSMAYNNFANPFLNLSGYKNAAALMTAGQVSEIVFLWMMPWLIRRIGLKWLFVLGLFSWTARYGCLALAAALSLKVPAYLAILLHGPCFAFIYVGGPMYMDHLLNARDRGLAQGIYSLAAIGCGHLAGAILVGISQEVFLTPPGVQDPPYDWTAFWLLPGAVSLSASFLFIIGIMWSKAFADSNSRA